VSWRDAPKLYGLTAAEARRYIQDGYMDAVRMIKDLRDIPLPEAQSLVNTFALAYDSAAMTADEALDFATRPQGDST
jgi:hypothetical protein